DLGLSARDSRRVRIRDRAGAGDPLAAFTLSSIVRAYNPHVVHAHGYRAAWVCTLAGVLTTFPPLVVTAHNLFPSDAERLAAAGVRMALARAHTVIAITQAVANSLSNAGIKAQRLRVIPNGIATPIPKRCRHEVRDALGISNGAPVLIVAARLMEDKGVAWALKAHALLRSRIPAAILLVAGDGPDRDALELMASELELGNSVRFLGFRDDVADLLAASDVCLVPSIAEGQSLVALEAMALGTPVVATSAGGLAEIILDGETGLLVPPMDHVALADATFGILSNPHLAEGLARAGRRHIGQHYTSDLMVDRVAKVYREAATL
ncbi:MAG: glycosyltransferase family 4 protein, partial [Armatimonadota bacterium]